jgi:hypothetical protein
MSQMPSIPAPSSFRGLVGVAREDITAPVGIYARSWGAAKHDVAEGVHRPLTLTCVAFRAAVDEPPLVLIAADLGWWRSREDEWSIRGAVLEALRLDESRLMFCLSHTHAGPGIQRDNADRPGGHLIAPYQEKLRDAAIRAARRAIEKAQPATLTWRYGACDLATNRDLPDPAADRVVVGFNPASPADDTLLVGRVTGADGRAIAMIVNYACHPTTLGWENRLLSPDYVGAMREVVETHTGAPCAFLQGASGELAPIEQYTGDTAVADRHGRRLGFAALSTFEAMVQPGARLAYEGVVESGAPLAVWRQKESPISSALTAERVLISLPLKPMPSIAEIEAQWAACDDPVIKERLWRKRFVRKIVGDGTSAEMPLWVWSLGDALLFGQPNEAYSQFQTELRRTLHPRHVAVMNLVNGSAGYLAPAELYDTDVYPVWQSPYERGGLERLIESATAKSAKPVPNQGKAWSP